MREMFSRNGLPECLVSDNGPQFVSAMFQNFMKVNGVQNVTSSPYHPHTNGQVEKLVYTCKQAMKASRKRDGTMQKRLSNFLLACRSTPHSTTGESLATLFMGRTLRTRLSLIRPTVQRKVNCEQEKMFVNIKRSACTFDIGEKVCVRDYRSHNDKLVSGTITSKTGPLSYKVSVGPGMDWRRHADQISSGNLLIPEQINPPVCDTNPPDKFQEPTKPQMEDNVSRTRTPTARRYPIRSTRGKHQPALICSCSLVVVTLCLGHNNPRVTHQNKVLCSSDYFCVYDFFLF